MRPLGSRALWDVFAGHAYGVGSPPFWYGDPRQFPGYSGFQVKSAAALNVASLAVFVTER